MAAPTAYEVVLTLLIESREPMSLVQMQRLARRELHNGIRQALAAQEIDVWRGAGNVGWYWYVGLRSSR